MKIGGINNGNSCGKTKKGSKIDAKTKTQVYEVLNVTIKFGGLIEKQTNGMGGGEGGKLNEND